MIARRPANCPRRPSRRTKRRRRCFPTLRLRAIYIAGQANIIFQADGPFHSPYEGTNSFIGRGEYKTSLLGTLYLGGAAAARSQNRDRCDLQPGIGWRPRAQRGARSRRIYQSGCGPQSQPGPGAVYGPRSASPDYRLHRQAHRKPANAVLPRYAGARAPAASSLSAR